MAMSTQDTLTAFSEWLDSEGLLKAPSRKDTRTHDQVSADFIAEWESTSTHRTLAGREPVVGSDVLLPEQP